MAEDSRLGWKVKLQISRFAGRLTEGMDKVKRRLVGEMLYGIQASQDVKVSNVARCLNESIPLIKTENRLCRNLADEDLSEKLNRWISWQGAGRVGQDTVLAIDLSDVRKDYAQKMQYLGQVRDGSTGEIAPGYWTCEVIGADPYGDHIVPLYGELYSAQAEEFRSENDVILRAVRMVSGAADKRGIFAIDRGGDRRKLLIPLLDNGLRFVVRQDGDRHVLLPGGSKRSVREAVQWCKGTVERRVELEREGRREARSLELGSLVVRLPERPQAKLWLVVIRGFGEDPIMLLTNVSPRRGRSHVTWISDIYLTRWKCEEAYRFLKQGYNLEDVRVRSYTALRNVYVLVHAALYFVSVVLGTRTKLHLIFKKVCEKARRFYEVASFYQYAVADGIHRILFASRTGPQTPPLRSHNAQRLLPFAQAPP